MTEFQELIQDAPNFVSMEHGELVAYAYGMFAAGTKVDAENSKLRECLQDLAEHILEDDGFGLDYGWMLDRIRELGVEVE